MVVAVLGLLLLGWFFSYMQRPDWDEGAVGGMLTVYFLLQNFPIILIAWFTTRFNKVHRRSLPEAKRKAILQRRGLFDFVSPFTVVPCRPELICRSPHSCFMSLGIRSRGLAVPSPTSASSRWGTYCLGAFVVYRQLYGRKTDPLQTHADRMRTIRVVVNCIAWVCIVVPIVRVAIHRAPDAGSGDMGPVRGKPYFPDLRASQFPCLVRATTPAGSG